MGLTSAAVRLDLVVTKTAIALTSMNVDITLINAIDMQFAPIPSVHMIVRALPDFMVTGSTVMMMTNVQTEIITAQLKMKAVTVQIDLVNMNANVALATMVMV